MEGKTMTYDVIVEVRRAGSAERVTTIVSGVVDADAAGRKAERFACAMHPDALDAVAVIATPNETVAVRQRRQNVARRCRNAVLRDLGLTKTSNGTWE
jgi:hypothetical protein